MNIYDGKKRTRKKLTSSKVNQSMNSLRKHSKPLNTPDPLISKTKDDWNTKMRMEREQRESVLGLKRPSKITSLLRESKIFKGAKESSDYEFIKEKVKMIEEQAMMKEKYLDTNFKDPNAYNEINDMLITSIKAKISLLKGIE
mmetsp:Transcript_26026/g.30031  ORF Transcript_26026/g.30031 Transcript_26026/m.30031 type:complete len:143 (-) Transcript_26026:41-469(-)